ncbi:hypothetical protein ACFSJY_05380 [Thalassotalea euphylliae]|uniref:hypothetical protein n=1 Tax=Thalassotalea euphylliae TaxID=1655234 RepID=UPI0036284D29
MNTLIVALISFIVGLALSGFIAVKFFVYGGQSVANVELKIYNQALESIEKGRTENFVKIACLLLPIAIENKTQLDASIFAHDESDLYEYGAVNHVIEAQNHLSKGGICGQTL